MTGTAINDLIYDWNLAGKPAPNSRRRIQFDDETLRDGLQNPAVHNPSIDEKIKILHLMNRIGIDTADLGLPGAGPHHVAHIEALAREIATARLKVAANVACRTVVGDVEPVAGLTQRVGIPIECCCFIGSSEIRRYTEDWDLDRMMRSIDETLSFCRDHQLPVMFVTEDTTRARPEVLEKLYGLAIDLGAKRLCFCDTCGHATPDGARNLIRFAKDLVRRKAPGSKIKIDWHGHEDRGLGVINSIAAVAAGAHRVHGAGCGIGERSGNAAMDLILVNLKLMGLIDNDLSALGEYVQTVSAAVRLPLPHNYPVFGPDAFETATGVHAAAVIKAIRKGDVTLANLVYSGVPAHEFGMEQKIRIGPMSGKSNVVYWLERHGHQPTEDLIDLVFEAGKNSPRLLTDAEVEAVIARKGL